MMRWAIGGVVAALALTAYATAADRRLLIQGESAWREYTKERGWREYVDDGSGGREWSDWWITSQSYPNNTAPLWVEVRGVCREAGYHSGTPQGDYIVMGVVCAHPFGAIHVRRAGPDQRISMSCQPGARALPEDDAEAEAIVTALCDEMAEYVGDHEAEF